MFIYTYLYTFMFTLDMGAHTIVKMYTFVKKHFDYHEPLFPCSCIPANIRATVIIQIMIVYNVTAYYRVFSVGCTPHHRGTNCQTWDKDTCHLCSHIAFQFTSFAGCQNMPEQNSKPSGAPQTPVETKACSELHSHQQLLGWTGGYAIPMNSASGFA